MNGNSTQQKSVYLTNEHAPIGWYSCTKCLDKGIAEPGTICHCEKHKVLPECPSCGQTEWIFTMEYK